MNLIMESSQRANRTLIRQTCQKEMQKINSLLPCLKAVLGENNAREIVNVLVQTGIRQLADMSLEELQATGLKKEDALLLIASLQLGRQWQQAIQEEPSQIITSSKEAAKMLSYMSCFDRENLAVIMLDTRQNVIDIYTAAVGGLDSAHTTMRELLKEAVKRLAACIVLAHNHPSGDPQPSLPDIKFTETALKACDLMGIRLLDHVIIGSRGKWASVMDENRTCENKDHRPATAQQENKKNAADMAARLLGRG